MKTITSGFMAGAMLMVATLALAPAAGGQSSSPPWFYTLVNGSQLLDDCPICDRLSAPVSMGGTFQLRLLAQGPIYSSYALENISFHAGSPGGITYQVTGQGIYEFGGEVANQQHLTLTLLIDDGVNPVVGCFTNDSSLVTRWWPMMQISVTETNGTAARVFHLGINAAPFREIWFSTVEPFTGGLWNPPTNAMRGDLLSSIGQVVKRNYQLCGRLNIMPAVPDFGLKDVGILPGGEIAFSIEEDVFSETLGWLHAGDLLTDWGRILRSNSELLSLFAPSPVPPAGAGLAAVKVTDSGAVYFSVQTNFYSVTLGRTVQTGDLLADSGAVVRSEAQLLANFNPAKPAADYGLSAVFLWPSPSTEIWFATTQGFAGQGTNFYAAGDLLSDQGYVVYRNSELVSAFAPAAGGTNLGLDALYVITDVPPAGRGLGPATLAQPQPANQPPASLAFEWSAAGHVFQLEKATNLAGPYLPASRIDTDGPFLDPGVLTNQAQAFYRLHQW